MVILLLLLIQVFIVHKLSKTIIWVYLTLEISLQKYNFVINLTMINVLLWSKDITWYHKLLNNTKLSEALVRKISHLVYIFHNNNSNIIFMGFVTKIILGKKYFWIVIVTERWLAFLSSSSSPLFPAHKIWFFK